LNFLSADDEPSLELVEMGRPWSFDPYVAVTTNTPTGSLNAG
jgi:hypothetical protein